MAPVIALAAHIPSSEIGTGYFQETHPDRLFAECSHYSELISNPEQMPRVLQTAIQHAVGLSGVAVVSLPGDIAGLDAPPGAAQLALVTKYDAAPYVSSQAAGSIPFIDFGNKYIISGASYDGSVLAGKSWAQISAALKDPTSPITKAIGGTANYITAAICKMTGNQPASACTATVQSLENSL